MNVHARLSALDAGFLAIEGAETPMHVGSVAIFDGEPLRDRRGRIRLRALRALVEERLALVPRFRQIVSSPVAGLGRPFWTDDPHFDITHHVREATVPAPGGEAELMALACRLHEAVLDRSRPLWELCFVDGLSRGRVGLVQKVHHSLVDGVAGVDVATTMMDLEPRPPTRHRSAWTPGPPVGRFEWAQGLVTEGAALPRAFARQARRMVTAPRASAMQARTVSRGAASLVGSGLLAPRASINRRLAGPSRHLESVTVSLSDVKAAGAVWGATVNDVVLAAVAGGVRRVLQERGERLVDVRALVPVSTRPASQRGQVGNSVAAIVAPLPVTECDPVRRLQSASARMRTRKESGQAATTGALVHAMDFLPAPVAAALTGAAHHQPFVNLVVTNIPGSPVPLFMLGSRLEEVVPIVPLARNLDLSVGILSYMDQLTFGVLADPVRMPDVHLLTEGIGKSVAELVAAIPLRRGPT